MTDSSLQPIATAVQRARSVLQRRPKSGIHDDTPATSRWQGGARVVTSHASGAQWLTDMPTELGGSGDQVTPGWLFRAGLAACATTSIVLTAAAEGVELAMLEVQVGSRSDARGLLGMSDEAGQAVYAGPSDMQLQVRVDSRTATAARLRALVERAICCSPVPCMVQQATPLTLQLDIASA
jgi:uncharacterized OsmC-like protein